MEQPKAMECGSRKASPEVSKPQICVYKTIVTARNKACLGHEHVAGRVAATPPRIPRYKGVDFIVICGKELQLIVIIIIMEDKTGNIV